MRSMLLVIPIVLTAGGCGGASRSVSAEGSWSAELRDGTGRTVGTARFTEAGDGVAAVVEVDGLPAGTHGVHVHGVGRCDPPTFESAGAHLNPAGKKHGTQNPEGPHLGDLPNLEVGEDGSGRLESGLQGAGPGDGATLLDADGSAVVVHARADDYKTDPSGDSGDRIACGVLVRS